MSRGAAFMVLPAILCITGVPAARVVEVGPVKQTVLTNPSEPSEQVVLLAFRLDEVAESDVVFRATLRYTQTCTDNEGIEVQAVAIPMTWEPGDVDWSWYQGVRSALDHKGAVSFEAPGCDGEVVELDVTHIVRDWVSGSKHTTGLLLQRPLESPPGPIAAQPSPDFPTPSLRLLVRPRPPTDGGALR